MKREIRGRTTIRVIGTAVVKQSTKDGPEPEQAIAQSARAAYDYFLFHPAR